MPKNRAGRFVYALLVAVLLFVIGRNVYRRSLNNRLIAAVETKNVAAVRDLLARGADPTANKPPLEGPGTEKSALALAMYVSVFSREQQDIVCLLLQHGAAMNLSADTLNKYLLTACDKGNSTLVRCLLEHGANANVVDSSGRNAITRCIDYIGNVGAPNISATEWTEAQRRQVETDRKQHRAASLETVRLLREHGARLNIWQATRLDDVEALRASLDSGVAVDASEPSVGAVRTSGKSPAFKGPTALVLAAQAGGLDCVHLLLKHGAKVNAVDDYPYSPLNAAIIGQHLEIARLLLQRGAIVNLNVSNQPGVYSTPFVSACAALPQLVPELIQRGADVKKAGGEALAAAIYGRHPELVGLLLKHGASVRGKTGRSVLYATIQCQPELVRFFLAQGADAREPADAYVGLISAAVRYKRKDLIAPLLRAGADIQSHTIYTSLIVAGKSVMTYTTPLIEALPQADMVAVLLQNGADPNRASSQGLTPLIIAAQSGNVEATRLLLAHGAKVNETGKMRQTPLSNALRHKHSEVAALLQQAGGHEQ